MYASALQNNNSALLIPCEAAAREKCLLRSAEGLSALPRKPQEPTVVSPTIPVTGSDCMLCLHPALHQDEGLLYE